MSWSNLTVHSRAYVDDVLRRGWLSYSKYMPRFEKAVASRHGAKHGILVNSGTDALRISLATLKEVHGWPDGSEVIVPALTFVATVNAILQNNLNPIFAEVDLSTANLDVDSIKFTALTVAVVPVHLFGLPVDMGALKKTVENRKMAIIEDSCETFGVHKLQGDLACFSFYLSHHVSTGVGGMILTNSDSYAQIARSVMNHGRIDDGSHFEFGRRGYSSRITELEAALGCAALEHFDEDLKKRQVLAKRYWDNKTSVEVHDLMPWAGRPSSWMFYPILIHGMHLKPDGKRDKLLLYLRKHGIESREAMPVINQPCFKSLYKPGSCPNAENWTANGLLLPLHPKMTEEDVDYVCRKVKAFFK